jgi:hypothetical protein
MKLKKWHLAAWSVLTMVVPAMAGNAANLITNGDFEATCVTDGDGDQVPPSWTKSVGAHAIQATMDCPADNGPSAAGTQALHWVRPAGSTSGRHINVTQAFGTPIDATTFLSLTLQLDVHVTSHNLSAGGTSTPAFEWPVIVQLTYKRASNPALTQVWRHGFYVDPPGDGARVVDPGTGLIAEYEDTQVTTGTWSAHAFDLLAELPDVGEITHVVVGAAGWGYEGQADNISISGTLPANTLVYFEESGGGGNPRGFYNYDTVTGVSTLRSTVSGSERFFGMDVRPSDGVVFTADEVGAVLYTVDVDTGAKTAIGSTGAPNPSALAFDPTTGVLYGLAGTTLASVSLYSVNQTTGAFSLIGNTSPVIRGLEFDSSGQLYGFEQQGDLYEIDKSNGSITLVGGSGPTALVAEDSAFTPAGELFFTDFDGDVFHIDVTTGLRTVVGNSGMGQGLLGLIPDPVPEPAIPMMGPLGHLLVGLTLLFTALALHRGRRQRA